MATANISQGRTNQTVVHVSSRIPTSQAFDLAMLTLDDAGMIRDAGEACEQVFGYQKAELAGRHVSTLLPQLGESELVTEDRVNPRLAFLCRCGMPFKARHRDGQPFHTELFINRLGNHKVVVLARSLHKVAA